MSEEKQEKSNALYGIHPIRREVGPVVPVPSGSPSDARWPLLRLVLASMLTVAALVVTSGVVPV